MTLVHLAESDQFNGEDFICQLVPRKHNLAKGTIAELLDQIILVELVLEALRLQQILQAFKLALLRVKVQQSRPVWWYVGLHGIENFRIAFVVDFLWLSDS